MANLNDFFQWRPSTSGKGYTAGGLGVKVRVIDGVVKVKVGPIYVEPKEFLALMETLAKGPSKDEIAAISSDVKKVKASHLSVVEDDEGAVEEEEEDEDTEDDTNGDDSVH